MAGSDIRVGKVCFSRVLTGLFAFGMAAAAIAPAAAQTLDDSPVIPARVLTFPGFVTPALDPATLDQRMNELKQWMDDYTEWKQWSDTWSNKTESGWLTARQRRPRPSPPEWLSQDCRFLMIDETGTYAEGCRLLAEYDEDPAAASIRQERTQREAPTKNTWWRHLHFDGLWPMTQSGGNVVGLFGVHATMDVVGRLQVFVAPGAMLLQLPTPTGGREWRPAPVWGISYKLIDFRMPGTQKQATLHANVVRAWVTLRTRNIQGSTTVTLAGFSLTRK